MKTEELKCGWCKSTDCGLEYAASESCWLCTLCAYVVRETKYMISSEQKLMIKLQNFSTNQILKAIEAKR